MVSAILLTILSFAVWTNEVAVVEPLQFGPVFVAGWPRWHGVVRARLTVSAAIIAVVRVSHVNH